MVIARMAHILSCRLCPCLILWYGYMLFLTSSCMCMCMYMTDWIRIDVQSLYIWTGDECTHTRVDKEKRREEKRRASNRRRINKDGQTTGSHQSVSSENTDNNACIKHVRHITNTHQHNLCLGDNNTRPRMAHIHKALQRVLRNRMNKDKARWFDLFVIHVSYWSSLCSCSI